ncbi:uncharacterized protein EV422DRAFT_502515 [Fimicolochytrium jonesii]|uniref:uncharacterized protein n=1 Tax=Fimicolochytrium jonesii TaxID=1396493 RepID=UPI0022FDBD21|nr:uncharacterized protein EV422DRAFT_502515 [Fimicolochytrium jonesii]KAI8826760.1 hypothetical protein EV422DRAFT_502515 [Fimicolochytrium jonesii]
MAASTENDNRPNGLTIPVLRTGYQVTKVLYLHLQPEMGVCSAITYTEPEAFQVSSFNGRRYQSSCQPGSSHGEISVMIGTVAQFGQFPNQFGRYGHYSRFSTHQPPIKRLPFRKLMQGSSRWGRLAGRAASLAAVIFVENPHRRKKKKPYSSRVDRGLSFAQRAARLMETAELTVYRRGFRQTSAWVLLFKVRRIVALLASEITASIRQLSPTEGLMSKAIVSGDKAAIAGSKSGQLSSLLPYIKSQPARTSVSLPVPDSNNERGIQYEKPLTRSENQ